jgi:hypothetical protein
MADIQIINRVYNLLGRNHQDSSISDEWGQIISDTIDAKIKIVLESHIWSFAIKFKKLARLTTSSNPSFNYEYLVPIDCFKIIEAYKPVDSGGVERINLALDSSSYEILGKSLYTNIDTILVKYKVGDISIEEIPQSFIEAVSYLSASELSMNLLENAQLSSMFSQTYQRYVIIAKNNDIQNGKVRQFNVKTHGYRSYE